ncbi:MAG: CopG family transcriptional regulator [Solirubrobacterales bacterium]|nr:CopG family transcriptional regulator [Solirubrobacterales bacterium]
MKKTSVYLDDALDHALAQRAAEEGLTKAELIRRTLSGAVQRPKRPKFEGIGIIDDGGPTDMAANVDRYLTETGFGE